MITRFKKNSNWNVHHNWSFNKAVKKMCLMITRFKKIVIRMCITIRHSTKRLDVGKFSVAMRSRATD